VSRFAYKDWSFARRIPGWARGKLQARWSWGGGWLAQLALLDRDLLSSSPLVVAVTPSSFSHIWKYLSVARVSRTTQIGNYVRYTDLPGKLLLVLTYKFTGFFNFVSRTNNIIRKHTSLEKGRYQCSPSRLDYIPRAACHTLSLSRTLDLLFT